MPATVVALQANYLEVELSEPAQATRLLCTRRTRLAHQGANVHVGDQVWVEAIDWQQCRGVVCNVEPRKSWLERPPVANVTTVVVALALAEPSFDADQASRFLLTAEQTDLDVQVLLTKTDLISADALAERISALRAWDYQPLAVSAKTGEGLDQLMGKLQGSFLSVLCGPSGVGKSSILNRCLPELSLRVGALSSKLQRGRHTTRHVELFALEGGARVADTPGFNRPDLPADPRCLASLFPELRHQLDPYPCRFRNCLHLDEPGCGVERSWPRYAFYRQCLQEMRGLSRPYREG
ncbi:MAG: ribosome small subunit-dependent GTPase A [Prochlorococcus sp.]|nr:ribosome small subunit-dependent GTPase A [Prochlorococcaceae cyanobacterium Fu_MAG_50]